MNTRSLAIATISWARDAHEATVLSRALAQLATMGFPLFITDAGSDETYLSGLQQLPNAKVTGPVKGLWPQTRASINAAAASGAKWIFYAEPDKLDFFAQHLPQMLAQIDVEEKSGIYLASRSAAGFATFPAFQQMTETTINRCCAELMGKDLDYIYGPFLMNAQLVPHLQAMPENLGWGWRPYTFMMAHRLGLRIEGFSGDFYCPEDQREDDQTERIYRMKQLAQNMEGLAAGASAVV
jgi:hypothetical protein